MVGRRVARHGAGRQAGSALVMVLAVAGALSVLALSVSGAAGTGAVMASREQARVEAAHIAEGALHRVGLALLDRASRARIPHDGTPVVSTFLGRQVSVRVRDVWGLVDINHAPPGLLRAAVTGAGAGAVAPALVQAITKARSSGMAFVSLEHLRRVAGVDPASFARARKVLTVQSGSPLVDPWAAGRVVLQAATAAPAEEIEAFVLARSQSRRPGLPGVFRARHLGQSPARRFRIEVSVAAGGYPDVIRSATLDLPRNPGGPIRVRAHGGASALDRDAR